MVSQSVASWLAVDSNGGSFNHGGFDRSQKSLTSIAINQSSLIFKDHKPEVELLTTSIVNIKSYEVLVPLLCH